MSKTLTNYYKTKEQAQKFYDYAEALQIYSPIQLRKMWIL